MTHEENCGLVIVIGILCVLFTYLLSQFEPSFLPTNFVRYLPVYGLDNSVVSLLFSNIEKPVEVAIISSPQKLKQRCASKNVPKLLIMINSMPKEGKMRNVIRETWGNSSNQTAILFVLGQQTTRLNQEDLSTGSLLKENQEFGDLLITSIHEAHANLTLKTYMMLWFAKSWCRNASFTMKTDSNIMSVPENLLRIAQANWDGYSLAILGYAWRNLPVLRGNWKFGISKELFSEEHYPTFLSGTGYLMRGTVPEVLFDHAKNFPWIKLEDVFFTGIVADSIKNPKIKRIGAPGFWWDYKKLKCKIEAKRLMTSNDYKTPKLLQEKWEEYLIAKVNKC